MVSMKVVGLAVLAAVVAEPADGKVLHVPLARDRSNRDWLRDLAKRADDDTASLSLQNQQSFYLANLEMGSDSQRVSAQIDTGSADLWVMRSSNPYCQSASSQIPTEERVNCSSQYMFDPSKSSSFSSNESNPFTIRYGDGSFANGTYAQDTVRFGSVSVSRANFALASEANSSQAVWGIGLATVEAEGRINTVTGSVSPTYSNIPMQLKEQGVIDAVAYSLWLNDLEASEGSLLFGGVDHAKYNGTLQKVPLVIDDPRLKTPIDFSVMLHGISVYSGSNSEQVVSCALPFLLDSGTTFSQLPLPFVEVIADSIGAQYDDRDGVYLADCSEGSELASNTSGITFDISGIEINVPFSEFLIPLISRGSERVCLLGIYPTTGSYILGDTFLRSAYAVYDLDNKEIALANVVYNASSSSIDSIGTSGIPSATNAPSYSSTQVQSSYSTNIASVISGVSASGGGGGASLGGLPGLNTPGGDASTAYPSGSGIEFSTLRPGASSSSSSRRRSSDAAPLLSPVQSLLGSIVAWVFFMI